MDVHMGAVTFPAPTTKDCGFPSRTAPGQNGRVLLCLIKRFLPDENQPIVMSSLVRVGVSHGKGRVPSVVSSGD